MSTVEDMPASLASHYSETPGYAYNMRDSDWEDYLKFRPVYPASMWDACLEYHKTHGGQLESAHDIGAGPGVGAKVLANYFSHVHVSDPGEGNITMARRLLKPASKFTFHQQPAEVPCVEDASVDIATIFEAIHWMDQPKVVQNVAKSLRPGGTFMVCFYGFALHFPDAPQLDKPWADFYQSELGSSIAANELRQSTIEGTRTVVHGLDSLAMPKDLYHNVLRLNINTGTDITKAFRIFPEGTIEGCPIQVTADERVQYINDPGWEKVATVEDLRGFLASAFSFPDEVWVSPEWRHIEHTVDQEFGGKIRIVFPVAIVLASRK